MPELPPRARHPLPFLKRIFRFGVVGGSGVVLNLGILGFLVEVANWHPLLASAVAIEISTLANYFANRSWTWRDRQHSWWSLLAYHGVILVGITTQWTVLALCVSLLGIHYLAAALLGIAAGTLWNFLGHHRVSFQAYTPERRARHLRVALYAAAAVLHLAVAALLTHDWDTFVFQRSVEAYLQHGTTPYETGVAQPLYTYWGLGAGSASLWYAYPPLPLLAMSATYAPAALGLVASPWLGRILVKIPFIVGTLGLAAATRAFITSRRPDDASTRRRARQAEAFFLFSPLVLIVDAVWGQFETVLLLLLVLSFRAMRDARWVGAGAFFGAAALIKIFPVYLAPVVLVHLIRRGGRAAAYRFVLAASLVFGVVSVPFLVSEPAGFLRQVFWMHADRAPSAYAPIAFVYHILRAARGVFPSAVPDDAGLADALSVLSFSLVAAALGLVALATTRGPANERSLLFGSAASLTAGLLATKVLSEQYLCLALGLWALYAFHPDPAPPQAPARDASRLVWRASALVVAASVFHHVLFLVMIPQDLALVLFGKSIPETMLALASSVGLTAAGFRALIDLPTVPLMAMALAGLAAWVWPVLVEGARVVGAYLHVHLSSTRVPHPHVALRMVAATAALLLVLPSAALGAAAPRQEELPEDAGTPGQPTVLMARYRTDWFNPLIRPEIAGGSWNGTTLAPAQGFYNTLPSKAHHDLLLLRAAGIDALLLTFHPAYEAQAAAVARAADQLRFPHALEVDLSVLADETGRVPMTAESARAAGELFDGPGPAFWAPGYHLRLDPGGSPLLFLRGVELVQAGGTPAEIAFRAEHEDRVDGSSSVEYAWWSMAFEAMEQQRLGATLEIYADAEPRSPNAWPPQVRLLGTYHPLAPQTALAQAGTHVVTVRAQPGHAEAFRAALTEALRVPAGTVLVSWNDFDLGQAVEPTAEHGEELLLELRKATGPPLSLSPTPARPPPMAAP